MDPQPIGMHLLPSDAFGQVVKRLCADDLSRLCAVPSHPISAAARADSAWMRLISQDFGSAVAASVAASANAGRDEAARADWLLDLSGRLSSCTLEDSEQKVVQFCGRVWRSQGTVRAAYWIIAHLVQHTFASYPDGWISQLTCGEPTEDAQARVVAAFAHRNVRAWIASRETGDEHTQMHWRCCLAMGFFLTMPKNANGASLSQAACRAYVSSFDFAGKDLVPALRHFLRSTAMPKEQARLCRMLWAFAGAFYDQNGGLVPPAEAQQPPPRQYSWPGGRAGGGCSQDSPQRHGKWLSHDAVYLLVMSLVVLHTDAHNPVVKTKMQV